jgi:hypothetical protein
VISPPPTAPSYPNPFMTKSFLVPNPVTKGIKKLVKAVKCYLSIYDVYLLK